MTKVKENEPGKDLAPVVKQVSAADRFTERILRELTDTSGAIQITDYQRTLCQNYFIKIDSMLKTTQTKEMAKRESDRALVPYTWENVNMTKLAQDFRAYSSLGLDPLQKNHINIIPFPNKHTKLIDLGFLEGYRGIELKAMKYGFNKPDDVIVRLVYSNQFFRPIFKDIDNKVESFEFKPSENAFDPGELLGGFYFHQYFDKPEKNKLVIFTKKDIDKRKPEYASTEFWGGEKAIWKDGKKTKETETVEGWYDEMAYKTVYRAAFDDITIDSKLIDDNFVSMMEAQNARQLTETIQVSDNVKQIVADKGNKENLAFDNGIEDATLDHSETPAANAAKTEKPEPPAQTEQPESPKSALQPSTEFNERAASEEEEIAPPTFGSGLFDKPAE